MLKTNAHVKKVAYYVNNTFKFHKTSLTLSLLSHINLHEVTNNNNAFHFQAILCGSYKQAHELMRNNYFNVHYECQRNVDLVLLIYYSMYTLKTVLYVLISDITVQVIPIAFILSMFVSNSYGGK